MVNKVIIKKDGKDKWVRFVKEKRKFCELHFCKHVDEGIIMVCRQITLSLNYIVKRVEVWSGWKISLDLWKSVRF